jgi:phospholipid transport system transporter-binding protein
VSQSAAPAFQLVTTEPGTLGVSGVLSFDTAAAATQAIAAALAAGSFDRLDLGEVRRSDSAGLACVLAAVALPGKTLRVVRMPPGMQALAKVCEVDRLIA